MGKFLIKQGKAGFTFNLKAANGEVIGVSESYTAESGCLKGVESVRKNCGAAVEDQTVEGCKTVSNPKYEVYMDKQGEFRFRLKAKNGENILASEGYKSKAGCLGGIESVKKNAPTAEIEK